MSAKRGNRTGKISSTVTTTGWLVLAALAISATFLLKWEPVEVSIRNAGNHEKLRVDLPQSDHTTGYVSSDTCKACHPEQYQSWRQTFHRSMTQPALPGNVAGKFDGSTVISEGLEYRVFQKGHEYWAEMPDPEIMMKAVMGGIRVDDHTYRIRRTKDSPLEELDLRTIDRIKKRVVMTTGSHHYQTYWVEGSVRNEETNLNEPKYGNLLQTLPLIYLFRDQSWIPRENAFMMAPSSKRMISQWNHHCIRCHSTAGNPGILEGKKGFNTRVAELGISCESCHGPAGEHIRKHRNPLNRYQEYILKVTRTIGDLEDAPAIDPTIVNPEKLDHKLSSQICGQCHGIYIHGSEEAGMSFAKNGPLYRPGQDIHQWRYYIQHPSSLGGETRSEELHRNPEFFRERWWDDGTVLAGGREFTAMAVSDCYTKGQMNCLSCHTMHHSNPPRHVTPQKRREIHADQLKHGMRSNAACTQCHGEARFTTELTNHTFHKPDSHGSNCLNCHMPHTTYALLGAIRNHQVQSPAISRSIRHGVPNACNLCHLDQTLGWAQDQMTERYGHEKLPLSQEQQDTSATLLWILKGHAAQRVIAAWHAGWAPALEISGKDWLAPFLARLLNDPYGVVRYVANESLGKQPGFGKFEFDFLADEKKRKQRVQAAVNKWIQDLTGRPSAFGGPVLIDRNGQLMETQIQTLLRTRDNRPFNIKE